MSEFDYKNPNYSAIFEKRVKRLQQLRENPELLAAAKMHYATHPWDFISDWGMTFEPRNIERGLLTNIPFVPWPRQVDFLKWMYERWQSGERGLVEKSRDCGVTWLCVGFAVSMWLFVDGFTTGFGSRKEELVDKRGDSKSIFEKIRFFIDSVPPEFMPVGYEPRTCSAHMRIANPDSNAAMIGESGDEIGRGGRASLYVVDEKAFVERQEKVDAALSQNTNCQIDVSTPNGNGNLFYKTRQRFNGTNRIFVFDWRDDPRKDDEWYQRQVDEQDEVTVAQEIDRDYNASAEDSFIPAKWVKAAIDAHEKLGITPEGLRVTGFDPADVGDAKAVVNRYGSIITEAKQLKRGDITMALPWAFDIADQSRADAMIFDADGMGAPTMKVDLQRRSVGRLAVIPYRGSGGIEDPDIEYGGTTVKKDPSDPVKTNQDAFLNFRAQSWTWVRDRFKATYDAIQRQQQGLLLNIDPDNLISISSNCECLHDLVAEISRPKRLFTNNGKIQVESKDKMRARGVDSPNLSDALVMAISVKKPPEVKKKKPMNFRRHNIRDRSVGY